jgi:uncharacterized membrane protein YtjA (UPF0391 family)
MLPWWMIIAVIALLTAAFGLEGPVRGAPATAQVYVQVFIGVSILLLVGRLLGKSRPFRISQRGGPFRPGT